ncbi:hypothetical protein B0O80DRAFT_460497 [Mortierella sp. GBAus27b]|nr:hypothetical protein B0O80DRAFT_460497 [Mortierella sp. GBAus27b]
MTRFESHMTKRESPGTYSWTIFSILEVIHTWHGNIGIGALIPLAVLDRVPTSNRTGSRSELRTRSRFGSSSRSCSRSRSMSLSIFPQKRIRSSKKNVRFVSKVPKAIARGKLEAPWSKMMAAMMKSCSCRAFPPSIALGDRLSSGLRGIWKPSHENLVLLANGQRRTLSLIDASVAMCCTLNLQVPQLERHFDSKFLERAKANFTLTEYDHPTAQCTAHVLTALNINGIHGARLRLAMLRLESDYQQQPMINILGAMDIMSV